MLLFFFKELQISFRSSVMEQFFDVTLLFHLYMMLCPALPHICKCSFSNQVVLWSASFLKHGLSTLSNLDNQVNWPGTRVLEGPLSYRDLISHKRQRDSSLCILFGWNEGGCSKRKNIFRCGPQMCNSLLGELWSVSSLETFLHCVYQRMRELGWQFWILFQKDSAWRQWGYQWKPID